MKLKNPNVKYIKYFLFLCLLVILVVHFVRQKSTFENPRTDFEKRRLDELIRRGDILVDYVKKNNYPTPEIAERTVKNWNILRVNNRIGITPDGSDTPGFVINKSDAMQLCLTKDNDDFPDKEDDIDDINLATFVLIHEISHLGAIEYQHGEEFISIFTKMLQASIDIGIWKYVDYFENPRMYCDFYVNVTPDLKEAFSNLNPKEKRKFTLTKTKKISSIQKS